jgi:2,5-furandicarboxylate decarboxylase 1
VIIGNAQGSKLDPSAEDGVSAKMGIDATKPLSAPEMKYKRIRIPGENEIDLNALLNANAERDWRKFVGEP